MSSQLGFKNPYPAQPTATSIDPITGKSRIIPVGSYQHPSTVPFTVTASSWDRPEGDRPRGFKDPRYYDPARNPYEVVSPSNDYLRRQENNSKTVRSAIGTGGRLHKKKKNTKRRYKQKGGYKKKGSKNHRRTQRRH